MHWKYTVFGERFVFSECECFGFQYGEREIEYNIKRTTKGIIHIWVSCKLCYMLRWSGESVLTIEIPYFTPRIFVCIFSHPGAPDYWGGVRSIYCWSSNWTRHRNSTMATQTRYGILGSLSNGVLIVGCH